MGETLGSLTTSFYLVIEKINLKRFLCFNYFSTEWIFKYYIGYNGLFEFNIPYQSIDSERYYDISDVKKWCNKAITSYYINKKIKEELKIKKNEYNSQN